MIIVNCRLAREAGLEYVEIQNLTDFYDDNRYISTPYYMFLFSTFPLFGLMFWKIIFISRQLFACTNFQMLECGLFANFGNFTFLIFKFQNLSVLLHKVFI